MEEEVFVTHPPTLTLEGVILVRFGVFLTRVEARYDPATMKWKVVHTSQVLTADEMAALTDTLNKWAAGPDTAQEPAKHTRRGHRHRTRVPQEVTTCHP